MDVIVVRAGKLLVMDALVAWTWSSFGHGCFAMEAIVVRAWIVGILGSGCTSGMDFFIVRAWMPLVVLDALVTWTLSMFGKLLGVDGQVAWTLSSTGHVYSWFWMHR